MITHVEVAKAFSSDGTLTFNLGEVAAGSFLVAILRSQSTAAPTDFESPAGWDKFGPAFIPSSAKARVMSTYGRFSTELDSNSTVIFSIPGVTTGRTVGVILAFTNVDEVTPVIGQSDEYAGVVTTGVSTEIGGGIYTLDASTTAALVQLTYGSNELVSPNELSAITSSVGTSLISVASTSEASNVTRSVIAVAARNILENSASQPSLDYISWPAISGATGHSIVLQEKVASGSEAMNVHLGDGRIGELHLWDGSASKAVKDVRKVNKGFSTVTEMLNTPGSTWAHRGGSANWGEMSMYAYTRSLIQGYGALEVSLARSSDGVWFGHHDETLDRVTGTTGLDPSTLTWAQIQGMSIITGADGIHQPFMTIDEYRDSYANDCVHILDLKYGIRTQRDIDEFFAICNSFPSDTVMIKYFYDSTGLAGRAENEGFATWGYAYPNNVTDDPSFLTRAAAWTTLGMTHDAPQGIWDQVLAVGKPVFGHIAYDQASYDSAMAKGASGVQCANVLGIKAVGPN